MANLGVGTVDSKNDGVISGTEYLGDLSKVVIDEKLAKVLQDCGKTHFEQTPDLTNFTNDVNNLASQKTSSAINKFAQVQYDTASITEADICSALGASNANAKLPKKVSSTGSVIKQ